MPLTIDEYVFSVNKIATSLLEYVVDLSAVLVGVDVRSDEEAFLVNKLLKPFWNMLLMYQFFLLLLMLYQMMTLHLIITD